LAEFNKLGIGEPLGVSAANGSGTGDLLDKIIKITKARILPSQKTKPIKVAIIGKPNVGKSSLINKLVGKNLFIVSPIPHTTREPNDIELEYKNNLISLIDTAGISKKGQKSARRLKTKNSLEKFSITKSLNTLKKADISLLIIDIDKGISHQETKLTEELIKTKTSFIIIANKWDLIKDKDTKHYTQYIYGKLPFAVWAPIIFTSALTGAKVKKILDIILEINELRHKKISKSVLSRFLNLAVKNHAPSRAKGLKRPFIYEINQTEVNPPVFAVRIGPRDKLTDNYLKYLENRLRNEFSILGTPLTIYVDKKKRVHGQHDKLIKEKK